MAALARKSGMQAFLQASEYASAPSPCRSLVSPSTSVKRKVTVMMKRDRISKRREKVARMAERAAVPEHPFRGRGPLYLIRPAVSVACAPSLQAIAAALRDSTLQIDEESLEAAWRFFTDGGTALYGYDVTEALREAVRLQQKIVRPEPVKRDQAPVGVAV